MTDSSDRLLAALAAIDQGTSASPAPSGRLRERKQLDLLLAASNQDATLAVIQRPAELGALFVGAPSFWLSHLNNRHLGWLGGALTQLLRQGDLDHVRPLFDALDRFEPHPSALPAYDLAMTGPWRATAARQLYRSWSDVARQILLRHDGPDLDEIEAGLRYNVRVGYLVTKKTPDLAPFLDPRALENSREEAVHELLRRTEGGTVEPALMPLVEGCLDDKIAPDICLQLLHARSDRRAHPALFRRLWPLAQRQQIPWERVFLADFLDMLVGTAPAPDLIALLLDELTQSDWSRGLVTAIGKRPDPHLVAPLLRWSQANPAKVTRKLVQPVLEACQSATPW